MQTQKPVVLLILDGWGHRPPASDNAISIGQTPNWDHLVQTRPICRLTTHGMAVGLPEGQMGNSEVGHMNIGAGRVVYQDLTRITKSIQDGAFSKNPVLLEAIDHVKASGGTLHVMGLLSDGGVHSHETHFFAMIDLALAHAVEKIALHVFCDGRDVAPRSAQAALEKLARYTDKPTVAVASVIGRYWAMDRDNRWDRTELAWSAIALGQAQFDASNPLQAIEDAYARDEDDEFIQPTTIQGGCPITKFDAGVFINFRSDRARQLTHALVDQKCKGFDQSRAAKFGHFATMTSYGQEITCPVAFPPQTLHNVLGEVVANANKHQLRLAETEKYAHVTYFLNGGEEKIFPGEERILIPSPKVATYDLQPQMSAPELGDALTDAILQGRHDLIVANLANPDMVGHTGKLEAAVAAVEAVDEVIGRVMDALEQTGAEAIITADHGNAEQMTDPDTGQAHTAHTTNPVPLVYVGPKNWVLSESGSLRDIAPTLLTMLHLPIPEEMTGQSLVHGTDQQ